MYGKFLPLANGGGNRQCADGGNIAGGQCRHKACGLRPPKALEALAEIGIQHTGSSKRADEFQGADFDLVVTVCDSAAEECLVWLGKGEKVHHSFFDPAQTDDMEDFRRVRDEIAHELANMLAQV